MNAFARFTSTIGRWIAPVVLAATVVAGSLGFSTVASAEERGPVVASHGVAGPRGGFRGPGAAPYHRGFVTPGWRGRHWGPGYAWGRPGWRAPARGFRGPALRGGGGFHGGGGRGHR